MRKGKFEEGEVTPEDEDYPGGGQEGPCRLPHQIYPSSQEQG